MGRVERLEVGADRARQAQVGDRDVADVNLAREAVAAQQALPRGRILVVVRGARERARRRVQVVAGDAVDAVRRERPRAVRAQRRAHLAQARRGVPVRVRLVGRVAVLRAAARRVAEVVVEEPGRAGQAVRRGTVAGRARHGAAGADVTRAVTPVAARTRRHAALVCEVVGRVAGLAAHRSGRRAQ